MNDDLEFTVPNQTFKEITTAKHLRVVIHNESRNARLSFGGASITKSNDASSQGEQWGWPKRRSWQGKRYL